MLEKLSIHEIHPSEAQATEMARVQLDAFAGQALRTAIFPRGSESYDDELAYRAGQIIRSAKDPHRSFLVAVAESASPDGRAQQKIIGYSLWITPPPLGQDKDSDEERKKKATESKETDRLSWPASMDHAVNEKFFADAGRIFEELHGPNPEEYWTLSGLAVHQKYQRRGLGTEMVRWGLDRALQDGKGVILGATPYARQFYFGRGFEAVGELRIGDETHCGMRIGPPKASLKRPGWGLQIADATW